MMDRHINKEVFIVIDSKEEEPGDIKIVEGWDQVLEELSVYTITDDDVRVFHGVLTLGEFIPTSLRGKSAFVLCMDPLDSDRGCIIESMKDDSEGLAEAVETAINHSSPFYGQLSHVALDIDDVYILYGYQIQTCLAIRDDDIDEEVIDVCKRISEETETIGRSYRKPSTTKDLGYVTNEYGVKIR
jgi:hypothetical protein